MTHSEKFNAYHEKNPLIYKQFERFTLELIQAGVRHYSADGILHKIRFETAIRGDGKYKINNTFSPDYARMFEDNHKVYTGFFEKRIRKAA